MCCCFKKRSQKLGCCAIASIATGIILLGIGIAFNWIMHDLTIFGAKQSAALTKKNEPMWRGIPGQYDIAILRNTYVYNVTNYEDVIYKGAKPIMEEFGPYIYREYDYYEDPLTFDVSLPLPTDSKTKKNAVLSYYT